MNDLLTNDTVTMGTLQVFTYTFTDDAALRFEKHFWEPSFAGDTINLHIFSAPDRELDRSHIRDAFQACVGMFNNINLDITPTVSARPLTSKTSNSARSAWGNC